MKHVQSDQFLPPCSSKLVLEPPMAPQLHREELGLETFEVNLPQLLTSTSPAPVKPDPVKATNVSPLQNLYAKERHSLLQVKKQNPASSCTIIYTPVTSNHIAKNLSKQKSEHNTHPCKSAANKQF